MTMAYTGIASTSLESESYLLKLFRGNLLLELMSAPICPYLELIRIDKPTGTVLMFWPFAWGLTMAAFRTKSPFNEYVIRLCQGFIGAFILRSSACTVNDMLDRNIDAGVERTKNRPLASGRITVKNAAVYLSGQYFVGVVFFYMNLQGIALLVSLVQLLPLFAIYPLLKRFTHWPQAWLGFAMNVGFITSWISITGSVDVDLLSVSIAGCWCWTMLYDTIYACQDIKDDIKMGVRSTAIHFGCWTRPLLIGCGVTFVAMLVSAGYINDQGPPYFIVSIGGTIIHLVWQLMTVDLEVSESCWKNFNRNGQLGWIVWVGLFIDYSGGAISDIQC